MEGLPFLICTKVLSVQTASLVWRERVRKRVGFRRGRREEDKKVGIQFSNKSPMCKVLL